MPVTINTNIPSLNAQRNLGINNSQLGKSLERLSSGIRINRAADDAAGLAIATKFGAQVKGLNQAVRNANDAISLVQTAEGGTGTLTNILQRLRELAVQSSSDNNTASDRQTLTSEANNLVAEFTRVANTSDFNTMSLLDGTFSGKNFQVGANYGQLVTFNIGDARGKSLGSRAQFAADVADGVQTARSANFGAGEFKVNGYDVAATASADDQYSVVDVSSAVLSTEVGSTQGGSFQMHINGTSVDVTGLSAATGASMANLIVSAINAASITNVTARLVDGSAWDVQAKGGTDLALFASATGTSAGQFASIIGISNLAGTATTASLTTASGASTVWGIGASWAGTSAAIYNGQSGAIAKAVAINTIKSSTAVTATAQKNVATGSSAVSAGSIASGDVYINGYDIGAATVTASDSTGALVSAINNQSASTGVTASKDSSGKLILTATDGRNITVSTTNTTIYGYLGLSTTPLVNTTAIFRSTVNLDSQSNITLSGTLEDLYGASANGIVKTTNTSKSQATDLVTYNVAAMAIDTQTNAQAAILTIDAALNQVNTLKSQIGAVQNRLEFTVANLQSAAENMTASQSRIMDADFAVESSKFTRNQIMVQAGTAMVAQSNQLSQLALQLLK